MALMRGNATTTLIIIIAIFICGGVFFAWKNYPSIKSKDLRSLLNTTVTELPTNLTLSLNSPEDDSLVFEKSLLISGKTAPNAVILISGSSDFEFEASNSGDFSQNINLSPGLNRLSISAFDKNGTQQTIDKQVYFSEEAL